MMASNCKQITNRHLINLNYRPDIDGLRALAIILVVAFHSFSNIIKAGFIGVDIFFVISGYLISTIIFNNLAKGSFSFSEFYLRRIRRIFPVLILVLFSCLIFGWFFLYAEEYKELAIQSAAGAGFVANFELLKESGYFDNAAEIKPLLHLWSLSIEEQFYIFWPLLLVLIARKKLDFLAVTIVIAISSFLLNIIIIKSHPEAAFYLPICRFFEIMIGSILSYLELHHPRVIANKFGNWSSVVGVVLIIISLLTINKDQTFPGYLVLLPCFGAFLIIASKQNSWINRNFLANKLMVKIGLISYPLYLWHWPLLSFATIVKGHTPRPELLLLLIASSVLLAYLSYKFIETPIRKRTNYKTIIILVSSIIMIMILSAAIVLLSGIEGRIDNKKFLLIRTMNRGQSIDRDCLNQYQNIADINYCRIAGKGNKKILVIGDSHSQAIFNGYKDDLVKNGYQLIHLANSGCPFYTPNQDSNHTPITGGIDIASCNKIFRQIINIITTTQPKMILFANNGWHYRRSDFAKSMQATIKMIPSSIPIVYFLQIPKLPFLPLSCMKRSKSDTQLALLGCSFPKQIHEQELVNYLPIINDLLKKNPNLTIIDPALAICNSSSCFALNEYGFLYSRDGVHLSINGGLAVARKFPLLNYTISSL